MDDLVRWLGEQLDEDERIARAATPGPWKLARQRGVEWVSSAEYWAVADCSDADPARENAEHVAEWDPARALREINGKRRIVQLLAETIEASENYKGPDYYEGVAVCKKTLRLLASVYADRPSYREEWAP